jgi:preprotein translocase subunit SecD
VQDKIIGGDGIITMGAANSKETVAQSKDLAETINAGALPFNLTAVEKKSISPILGKNALNVSLKAGVVALLLVWLFMLVYYRLPGILANIALLLHTVIQIQFIAYNHITLTLPGIAGIILTIGMGVDANVIIFERIKEELKNGKTLRAAIDVGFKRAFAAILDANITTTITGLVLWYFGSGPVKSFAITLIIGVLLSFFTAITASRILLKSVSDVNIAKHRWLYGAK